MRFGYAFGRFFMETKEIKGIKLNMTQLFNQDGSVVPVTMIKTSSDLDLDMENKDVIVVGRSKGKNWMGVMKKWNFRGGPATRGQSDRPRAAGSIGGQTPGRVLPGKKMAGRFGNRQVTIKGLRIAKVALDDKCLFVSGPVPGTRNSEIIIRIK